jgi:hypothetical protein
VSREVLLWLVTMVVLAIVTAWLMARVLFTP